MVAASESSEDGRLGMPPSHDSGMLKRKMRLSHMVIIRMCLDDAVGLTLLPNTLMAAYRPCLASPSSLPSSTLPSSSSLLLLLSNHLIQR